MTHKYYDVLGVARDSSKDDIRRAYKRLAVQMHPDKGGDPEKFKELAAAYEVLSDEDKRQRYDQLGDDMFQQAESGGGGGGYGPGFDPQSIFEQFFGGGGGFGGGFGSQPTHMKKRNHHHELSVSLEDAYRGIHKSVKVSLTKICKRCKDQCYACQGRGTVTDMRRMGFFTQVMERVCDSCSGSGFVASKGKSGCKDCNGSGMLKEEHKIEIDFPAGVATGNQVVFKGLGEQAVGDNETSGDLVFEVRVHPHAVFQRDGNNLMITVALTFAESVVGKEVRIPHFAGEFSVNTATEFGIIQPDKRYVIRGKGMSNTGDLFMTFTVTYPSRKLNDKERADIRKLFKEVSIC